MKQTWIIACQELRSQFNSIMAYILLLLFLAFCGVFTWINGNDIFIYGQASLQIFFSAAYTILFFLIPALTMRTIAEETRTGTLEMLLTKPISCWQIIVGKYIATIMLIAIALTLTFPYYISVACLGNIDHGATICGYLGLLLVSSAYASIGILASSLTNNQIVSFLVSLTISLPFYLFFGMIESRTNGLIGRLALGLNMNPHFESIARGVIDSKDIIYFASLSFIALFLAEKSLKSKIA